MNNGALTATCNTHTSVFRLTVNLLHAKEIGHIVRQTNCVSVMQELSCEASDVGKSTLFIIQMTVLSCQWLLVHRLRP